MRDSLFGVGLSFDGVWLEESSDPIRTKIFYRLLTYKQLIRYRNKALEKEDYSRIIFRIDNVEVEGNILEQITNKKVIQEVISEYLSSDQFENLWTEIIQDSVLSRIEYRKLQFITYYLNWKADELTRRKNYDCDNCRKWNFIDDRYCFLEQETYELPNLIIDESPAGFEMRDEEPYQMSIEDYLEKLDELSIINKDLSIFDISQKYYTHLIDDDKPNKQMEVCPEAIKIKAEYLAELFEMEARAQEYNVFPFDGNQMNQPAIVLEAFDAIRTARNTFHSKKMQEMGNKK